jgi:hypothetical protein
MLGDYLLKGGESSMGFEFDISAWQTSPFKAG